MTGHWHFGLYILKPCKHNRPAWLYLRGLPTPERLHELISLYISPTHNLPYFRIRQERQAKQL